MSKWIKLDDEKPDDNDNSPIIIYLNSKYMGNGVTVAYYTQNRFWSRFQDELVFPTHWMSLPEPPAEGEAQDEEILEDSQVTYLKGWKSGYAQAMFEIRGSLRIMELAHESEKLE